MILLHFLPVCREHTYLPLLLMALENITSVFLGKSFRALLFSASQGSRNCEIISILCLYVPWSCLLTARSETEIWPQGFANDAFSLSMAHAHSWGVTELAFIVPHFEEMKPSDFLSALRSFVLDSLVTAYLEGHQKACSLDLSSQNHRLQ